MSADIRVLIVDDEQLVLDGLRRTLRHESYQLETTTSPLEALDRLEQGAVDILISDIDMPEMTGLELIARARKRFPQVIRILLTGDSSLESALAAINDGAVHKYLTKPWKSKELRETLRSAAGELEVIRQQADSMVSAADDEQRREALESEYPGILSMTRVEGAYLLHDMRVVESLVFLGPQASVLASYRWLSAPPDATMDLKSK